MRTQLTVRTRRLTAVVSLLTALTTLHAQASYTNPVIPHDWPDPTVWRTADGRFYSMATGGRPLQTSTDLAHWTRTDVEPFDRATWDTLHTFGWHLWAPDVTTVGRQRIAYVTTYNSAEDASIVALRETSPGRFRYASVITRGRTTGILDTIDPEVVTDPRSGRVWMFFGSIGGIHRIELTADGLAPLPGTTYEHVAGLTSAQDPSREHVFEGSYLHRHGRYWYLFVSSGWYNNATYSLRVGRSKRLDGTFVDRDGRPMSEGHATFVLRSDEGDRFYGPGHCGEIFTDRRGHDYILYHAHDRQLEGGNPRPTFLQRIRWGRDGWPYVEGGKPAANGQTGRW